MAPVRPRPLLHHRVLGVWIAAAVIAGFASLASRDEPRQRVASDLPPIAVTVPSLPPITVPGLDVPPITVPDVRLEVELDLGLDPALPPQVLGPVLDLVGGAGSPVDIDRPGLWLIDADTGSARIFFTDLLVNEVAFAPDGRRAAVTTFEGRSRHGSQKRTMWVLDLVTGARRPIAGPVTGLGGPSWSPDGRLIAYSDWWTSPDGPFDEYVDGIWVVRPDGSGRRRVAGTDQYGGHMSWSPDSRFITGNLVNDDRVLVAGVVDGTERRHPYTDPAYSEWSPTGGLLAVGKTFDGPLDTMDPMTGATRTIAADLWGPKWSPDGTWIAAEGDDPGEGTFVLRPDGSERRHVSDLDLRGWATDSRHLLLGGYGIGQSILDLQTGEERVISNRPAPGLDWSSGEFVPGTHRAAMLVYPATSPPPPGL